MRLEPCDGQQQGIKNSSRTLNVIGAQRIEDLFTRMGKVLDAEKIEESRTALDRMQGAETGVNCLAVFLIRLAAKS